MKTLHHRVIEELENPAYQGVSLGRICLHLYNRPNFEGENFTDITLTVKKVLRDRKPKMRLFRDGMWWCGTDYKSIQGVGHTPEEAWLFYRLGLKTIHT